MHQPGGAGRASTNRGLSIEPVTAMSSSLSSATSGEEGTHRALQMNRHSYMSNPHASAPENDPQVPPRDIAGWIVEPIAFPREAGVSPGDVGVGNGSADDASRHAQTASESQLYLLQDRQQQLQQQQQQQQRQEAQSASTVATLVIVSVFTYALYHASVEALVVERSRSFFEGTSGVEEAFHYGRDIASAAKVTFNGSVSGSLGDNEVDGEGFQEAEESPVSMVWGRGVSLVTVSVWQSLSALGTGFIASRFWRRGRKPEPSVLSDADRVSQAFGCCYHLGDWFVITSVDQ